jgi:hypothetical protein
MAQLSKRNFARTSPELRDNVLHFYADLSASIETRKDQNDWKSVLSDLEQLESMTPIPVAASGRAQLKNARR